MARKFKKLFATLLALCVVVNPIAMEALAEEEQQGNEENTIDVLIEIQPDEHSEEGSEGGEDDEIVIVETQAGLEEEVEVETEKTETTNEDGTVTVETTQSAEGYVTESGMTVEYEGSSTMTSDDDGVIEGEAETNYVSYEEGEDSSYIAMGGSDTVISETDFVEGTEVDVPLTDEDDPETEEIENVSSVEGEEVGTVIDEDVVDPKESPEDGEYDYTTTTVTQQGSVTVTTESVEVTEGVSSKESDLEYTLSDTTPTADNNLLIQQNSAATIPGENDEIPQATEGYDFVYIGTQNTSQFWAAYLYKTPGFEGEEPIYTDENGQSYYLHRDVSEFSDAAKELNDVDDIFIDGERVELEEDIITTWDSAQQFLLIESKTGEMTTVYCADQDTIPVRLHSYNIGNIEDAEYYNDDQAAMIRSIANNGYWGSSEDDKDLESMKNALAQATKEDGTPYFTEEELALLTDGVALTATQFAIWTYSAEMQDIAFVNAHYIPDNNLKPYDQGSTDDQILEGWWGSDFIANDVPAEEKDHVDLVFKLYDYLVNLEPTYPAEEKTTQNTVITQETFIEDLTLTVVEKAENHINNQDSDNDNDAYVTNLTFKLVVKVDPESDDLVVTVLDSENNEKAVGRIAGTLQDGETWLADDGHGNYTFRDLIMTEGEQNFNITLDGLQNLEEGVYIYTSEVKNDTPSQTFVGIAEGAHAVNVSMNITFDLSVTEEVVAVEHVWREETIETSYVPFNDPPPPNNPPREKETPPPPARYRMSRRVTELETIVDEEVPLAEVPQTGDMSAVWFAMVLVAMCGLCVLKLQEKKCRA